MSETLTPAIDIARCALRVRGQVQGVGFRPFVHRLANGLGLSGWVRNDAEGVALEVQGRAEALRIFRHRLERDAPPLARIDAVEERRCGVIGSESGFRIEASAGGVAATAIAPDSAVCPDCLAELFEPTDRRYRYPFINCTHCGPRYTLTAKLPYDRPNTSMAGFVQCSACQREYDDPADRRFHAQPNACPVCGPRLTLLDAKGRVVDTQDVIADALNRLLRGEILALKGIGGFHLVCDARNADAVARLRERKQREEKPFAVMVANTASLADLVTIDDDARALLAARERPVVLVPKRGGADPLPGAAPGLGWLGVMLPYAPLHWLLFHEAAGRPAGTDWLEAPQSLLLVCTSANPGGEPLVTGNDEAVTRLAGIADAFVVHDRDILVRCDDSVAFSDGGRPAFLRRARGYTPAAIRLARGGPSVLALGAQLKNTLCATRGSEAFLSQHIGDLDNAATCRALEETATHLLGVLDIRPRAVACDLHPDFHSSRLAARLADEWAVPLIGVQHHHAHIAAVMAEHGLDGPVLGLALDGVGLGSDGAAWGGELLRVDVHGFERIGHLATLPLPGGDRAAREPWRMAAAVLHRLGRGGEIAARFNQQAAASGMQELLTRGLNCPPTSSAGRLFDAAAGLLGIKPVARYEGQAPMLLEGLAERCGPVEGLHGGWHLHGGVLDFLPLLECLSNEPDAAFGAALFHATLIDGLTTWLRSTARERAILNVALAGGCMLNRILSRGLVARLEAVGLSVHTARLAPPNDGGIALGQAWVAMRRSQRES
ncbi:MAG: carbamoyltransferase HypF [Chromatiales bacterium]|nr:carbamoyltransferase HypF [Chromatiales bacterium]